jgi:hypothetical protein
VPGAKIQKPKFANLPTATTPTDVPADIPNTPKSKKKSLDDLLEAGMI